MRTFAPGPPRTVPDATAALQQLERLLAEAGELRDRIASACTTVVPSQAANGRSTWSIFPRSQTRICGGDNASADRSESLASATSTSETLSRRLSCLCQ